MDIVTKKCFELKDLNGEQYDSIFVSLDRSPHLEDKCYKFTFKGNSFLIPVAHFEDILKEIKENL